MKSLFAILFLLSLSFGFVNDYNYISFKDNAMITNAANVIMETQTKMPEKIAYEIAFHLYDATTNSDIDYEYALAVMMVESRFKVNAVSPCGAIGLMQVMPSTFRSVSKKHMLDYTSRDIYDIRKNIIVGVLYLSSLKSKYGSYDVMSAGYNGGPVAANNWVRQRYSVVPVETRKYVYKVKKYHEYYMNRLNEIE